MPVIESRARKSLRDKAGTTPEQRGNKGCSRPYQAPFRGACSGNGSETTDHVKARFCLTPAETKRALGRLTGDPKAKTEAQVQREIVNALKLAGWAVWRIGQRDARKTQDPGVPDLYAMRAGFWSNPRARADVYHAPRSVWIEVKRPVGGVQSDAQRRFEASCAATFQTYILARSVDDIKELLT
ncbi:MAG TPA: hypothetical protein VN697_05920 [Tepidiformaceae bacterium]|nr:hypothetical protein [Tepidiformaceae bacterium]